MPFQSVKHRRTTVPNTPPTGLLEGELSVEMAEPARLWVGVPTTLDANGRKLLSDRTADKAYIDSVVANKVDRPGDTMTGDLKLTNTATNSPTLTLDAAGPSAVATIAGTRSGLLRWQIQPVYSTVPETGLNSGTDFAILRFDDNGGALGPTLTFNRASGLGEVAGNPVMPLGIATKQYVDNSFVLKSGDIMTGFLTLSANPVDPMHAATKQYVDALTGLYVDVVGDTMTGFLTLNADPQQPLHAATKQYVDSSIAAIPPPPDSYTKPESDARYVDIAGDTMTGFLTLNADPQAALHAATKQYVDAGLGAIPPNPDVSGFVVRTGDTMGGPLYLPAANPVQPTESAHKQYVDQMIAAIPPNPDVSNFVLRTGDTMSGALNINATLFTLDSITCDRNVLASGAVNAGGSVFSGGVVVSGNGQVVSRASPVTDSNFWFENEAGTSLGVLTWSRGDNTVYLRNESFGTPVADIVLTPTNTMLAALGVCSRQGTGMGYGGSIHNWYWNGSAVEVFVDATNLGTMTIASDYRIKKDVAALPSMWEAVKALRPISYTLQDFMTPADAEYRAQEAARMVGKENIALPPNFKPRPDFTITGDDKERWGFIAHELQETLVETAATAYKDAPDAIQSPNPWTVIATLTKALQEAMARIEALEAAGGAA